MPYCLLDNNIFLLLVDEGILVVAFNMLRQVGGGPTPRHPAELTVRLRREGACRPLVAVGCLNGLGKVLPYPRLVTPGGLSSWNRTNGLAICVDYLAGRTSNRGAGARGRSDRRGRLRGLSLLPSRVLPFRGSLFRSLRA